MQNCDFDFSLWTLIYIQILVSEIVDSLKIPELNENFS